MSSTDSNLGTALNQAIAENRCVVFYTHWDRSERPEALEWVDTAHAVGDAVLLMQQHGADPHLGYIVLRGHADLTLADVREVLELEHALYKGSFMR